MSIGTTQAVEQLRKDLKEAFGTHAAGGHSYLAALAIACGKGEQNVADYLERIAESLERIAAVMEARQEP
jgi:hypothetical protein